MKKLMSKILVGVLFLCLPLLMTSCEGLVTAFNDNPISPGLKVSTPTIQVEKGKTFKCNAKASSRTKLVYTSADPSIATVDSYGIITGVAEGKTTITVTTEGKDSQAKSIFTIESLTIPVEVVILEVPVESVKLDQTELTVTLGDDPVKLVATVNPDNADSKTVEWTTSDETVATVEDGVVTFVGGGTATITATATNGTTDAADDKTAECELTVKCLVDKITLNKTSLDLLKGGDGETLTATINPTDATETELKWESSKPAVATVDANGKVTPVAPGYATITCTATNGTEDTGDDKTATCEVTVATLLTNLTADYEVKNGDVLKGKIDGSTNNIALTIADGATVTLDGMTINGDHGDGGTAYQHAGLTFEGDATIILKGVNEVTGFHYDYPGIYVAPGKTLTIKGDGQLEASCSDPTNGCAAGIGGGSGLDCGNIVIESGNIIAKGGKSAAGIGGGGGGSCGDITIKGGDITASCIGNGGAGIGLAGNLKTCGDITITGGTINASGGTGGIGIGFAGAGATGGKITITGGDITATGGSSKGVGIGAYANSTCGDIDISGGTIVATGIWKGAGIGAAEGNSTYPSSCGNITITGGDITATGGSNAAGIGTGKSSAADASKCGDITITVGVTQVTATRGADATNSIGLADANGACGTITIGGVVKAQSDFTDATYTYEP